MSTKSFWAVFASVVATALVLVPSSLSATDLEAAPAAAADDALQVALDYVDAHPGRLGATRADVADLSLTSQYTSRHNGVTHVNLNQRFRGLEVFGAHATVNVAADGTVIFARGAFVHDLRAAGAADADLAATDAVEAAAEALDLADPQGLRVLSESGGAAQKTVLSRAGISDSRIPARLGWQPTADGLRLAWQLVIDDASGVELWNATVDARNGELLARENWTSSDDVVALTQSLGRSGGAATAFVDDVAALGSPNPVVDGSSYRVFAPPKESPNDGPRTLEENPADATASPFGWHDTDGAAGAEFTTAQGNNAHAYTDHNNDNAPTGGLPAVIVDAPSPAAGTYDAVPASFGSAVPPAGVPGAIVLVNDGVGTTSDGCEPFTLPAGALALIDRGTCPFTVKVLNAQTAGAPGVIVANNVAGPPISMGGDDPAITIPSVMISLDDGNTIKAGLPANGSLAIVPEANPSEPEGGPGLDFDFPIDLATEHPHDYWDAAVTNLFYWNNTIHDVLYAYGFDEESGNFQANNYGRGGLGGDYVRAEAQDGGGTNNANFSPPPEPTATGAVPRMQMYLWPNQTPVRDGDFDNGVIIHEYGHGVSTRLTGGPAVNC
ncbi:MAG: M36 family metallopeptidase, partial [Gaiellaceae bacterium]